MISFFRKFTDRIKERPDKLRRYKCNINLEKDSEVLARISLTIVANSKRQAMGEINKMELRATKITVK